MNFSEAKNYIKSCLEKWEALKNQFEGRERELLEQSYLVVSHPSGQMEVPAFNLIAFEGHREILSNFAFNHAYLKLLDSKKKLLGEIERLKRELAYLETRIRNFNANNLELNPFAVEIRFKQLNFDLIQKLKQSEFVDKSKTDISRASIRIVLKGQDSQDNRDG